MKDDWLFRRSNALTDPVLAVVVALVILVGPVGPGKAATDEAALNKAKELIEVTGMASIVDQMLPAAMEQAYGLLVDLNPNHGPEIQALLDEHMLPAFRRRVPEFLELSAHIYARHFTASELDEILAFYKTPVGRKAIEKLPVITQQAVLAGEVWGGQVATDAMRDLVPKLREKGLNAPSI